MDLSSVPLEWQCSNLSVTTNPESPNFYSLFPNNSSMGDEFIRLFDSTLTWARNNWNMGGKEEENDFHKNGIDSEYCPDMSSSANFLRKLSHKKKSKLSIECVFCRNNGEEERFFKSHILKDKFGRVQCPVLRKYTCPMCKANGDDAHTIKYCPLNKSQELTSVCMLRTLRTSTGKRRR